MVSSSPLDPAFVPPTVPDRVGQGRGIKLSYFACKRKLDKLGDKAIKTLLAGKVTHIPSDFNPNSECEKYCRCIRSLTIIMHGEESWIRKNDTNVRAHWGERFLTENANNREISDMFKGINFCSSCELEIRACYLGSSPYLKRRLEQNTGCKVTLYEGLVKAFFPYF